MRWQHRAAAAAIDAESSASLLKSMQKIACAPAIFAGFIPAGGARAS
jgi:hypothetical protein